MSLGRFDEAEIAFKRRLSLAPRSDMTRFYLACLYGRIGRHEQAQRHWHETMEVNPSFSVDHLKRALPYRDPDLVGGWTPRGRGLHLTWSIAVADDRKLNSRNRH
ncbi:tetratricopeptide repeat protein [Sinorhizobium terangae]|uniref:tetratricopeptide repeat protein n=1 Tax=Sinorhizobium terangae TaxID=110322 RepID=UPI0024B257A3|nr:tetratricopeptide repeat protein [Sinorhizobium terangae]WFU50779.1 tetratricopeptide repeat protein [Sinorhizobium terangae]